MPSDERMSIWSNIKRAGWKAISALVAVGGVLGGTIVFFAQDYAGYVSGSRAQLDQQYLQAAQSANEVEQRIRALFNRAADRPGEYQREIDAMVESLLTLNQHAHALQTRVPAIEPQFDSYQDAMIELRGAAERFTGSIDAREFVEASSEFKHAREEFERSFLESKPKYLEALFEG